MAERRNRADSNGKAPGQGHFGDIVDKLGSVGYNGRVGIEILPIPAPNTAAYQAIEYLRPLMGAAGQ